MASGISLLTASLNGGSAYTLVPQPGTATRVHAERRIAELRGLDTTFSFDWGVPSANSGLEGTLWTLGWVRMNNTNFERLEDYHELPKDTPITWDAGSTKHLVGHTYQVTIAALRSQDDPFNTLYKLDVEMDLIITVVN